MVQPPEDEHRQPQPSQANNPDAPDQPTDETGIPVYSDPSTPDQSAPPDQFTDPNGIPVYGEPDAPPATTPPAGGADAQTDEQGLPLYPEEDSSFPPPPIPYTGPSAPYQYAADDEPDPYAYPGEPSAEDDDERDPMVIGVGQSAIIPLVIFIAFLVFLVATILFWSSNPDQIGLQDITPSPGTDTALSPDGEQEEAPDVVTTPGTAITATATLEGTEPGTRTPDTIPGYPEPGIPDTPETDGTPGRDDTSVAIVPTAPTDAAYPQPGVPTLIPVPTDTGLTPDSPYPQPTQAVPPTQAPLPTQPQPTQAVPPTQAPLPTQPQPTQVPPTPIVIATEEGPAPPSGDEDDGKEPIGEITLTPTPTEPIVAEVPILPPETPGPVIDQISSEQRWTAADSPIVLGRSLRLAPGAVLVIEPGVEIRLASRVAIIVDDANLLALGTPEQPVRFVGRDFSRWEAIYGEAGSLIVLEHAEISGGGASGTVLTSEEGEIAIRASRIHDNGGTILVNDSTLEMRNSEIVANDMPYGGALNANYNFGNFVTLVNNRIAGNRLSADAPGVEINNFSTFHGLVLDIQGNLMRGGVSNLRLVSNGQLEGIVRCNAFIGNESGLSVRTQTLQVPGFDKLTISHNFMEEHTPVIVPVYLDFGIGRGATSEVNIDMRNNWWGNDSGPYHPDENPEGRGEAVGANILFDPWLRDRPDCAPHQ